MAKRFYRTSDVAEILGITVKEVYPLIMSDKITAHRSKHIWLIDKNQPYLLEHKKFSEKEESETEVCGLEKVNNETTIYVKDLEHDKILFGNMKSVKQNLCIATANIKNLRINGRHILEILNELASRKVKIRVLCSSPLDSVVEKIDEYDALRAGVYFKYKVCIRNHMKLFIFDWHKVYLGSANLTNAAMGNKSDSTRNFEAGLLTTEQNLVRQAYNHFNEVWSKNTCLTCEKKSCNKNDFE